MNTIKKKSMTVLCMAAMVLSLLFVGRISLQAATTAPTGLKQVDATSTSVEVSWNAVMQNDINYYYRISENANFASNINGYSYSSSEKYISGLSAGKTYYVQVGTSATYASTPPADTVWSAAIDVTTAPAQVASGSIKQTAVTTTSMTLSWTAPAGANYYEIKYWKSGASSDTAKTVSSTTNSVKLSKLSKNTVYNVSILSYRKNSKGYLASSSSYGATEYSLGVLPTKVKGVENTIFYSYINVAYFEWDKSASADGYQYYIYDNSGKKILSGKSSSNSLRVDSSKIKKDQFYRIKVRGYVALSNNKTKYGEWSDLLYFARTPDSKVTAKQSGKNIKVSWNKVTGATNYTVYVSTKEKTGYKKVGTTSKTNMTIKKYNKASLKSGKTYYVRIIANKKVKSKTYTSDLYYYYARSVKMKY